MLCCFPGSCSESSLAKLHPYHRNSEEEDLNTVICPLLFTDIPVLPGDSPVEGYDDAREVSDPGEHPVPGQGDWQVPRAQEDGEGPRDAARGEREMQCCSSLGAIPGAVMRASPHGFWNFPREASMGRKGLGEQAECPTKEKSDGPPRRSTPRGKQLSLLLAGENLHSWRSAGVPEVDGDTSPLSLESTGYDDADEMSLS